MPKNQGFTLIETFVAITVLVIAVLGPMTLLSRALYYSGQIENEMITGFLAQEGIEVVINLKDKNVFLRDGYYCADAMSDEDDSSKILIPWLITSGECPVETDIDGNYRSGLAVGGGVNATIFYRTIIVETPDSDYPEDKLVTSRVSWLGHSGFLTSMSHIYQEPATP